MKKQYDHTKFEDSIYERWEGAGAFSPPPTDEARERGMEPFSIIMPPPNANDPLHVGHAMFVTLEDILIRYHRMKGDAALWLPGTDHAGIETQYVFEKKLKKQDKSRFSFDRETLYEKIWEYVQENSEVALSQMKKLGASADWERTTFTLDDEVVDFVLHTFETMHKEGLIYRDLRLVNYCTKCGTGYSDLEVKHVETQGSLYTLLYPFKDGTGGVRVATTRPETMLADVAVAVHPEDERYEELVGTTLVLPLVGREIPVIADEYVDPEFGTGAVKITPYHDPNDFAVWQRHEDALPEPPQVISMQGKITEVGGEFEGLNVQQGREAVLKKLEEEKVLLETAEHEHSAGHCYRCSRVIEPLPMAQFFVKVKPLTERVLEALDAGKVDVHGAGHDKVLRHWLDNLHDWNISRQIVWGIRLPIWYQIGRMSNDKLQMTNPDIVVGFLDGEGNFTQGKIGELLEDYSFDEIEEGLQTLTAPKEAEYVISRERPSSAKASEGKRGSYYLQDTDTFDTWFSSSQWPVVTLQVQSENLKSQAPQNKQIPHHNFQHTKLEEIGEDLAYYYPTSVMETAYDILMFWVMRMLMMGIYLTGEVPFRDVYLHGLVRDEKGEKMSKSKGNVVNPLELVDEYGADALRMALVMSTTAGQDSAVGTSKVKGMRNFANKIWNASRYVTLARQESADEIPDRLAHHTRQAVEDDKAGIDSLPASSDNVFQQRLAGVVEKVTSELERLKIGQAAETVHNEFWHWFCDECIEQHKDGELSLPVLMEGLKTFLVLIHPFMPFVTEVVWQEVFPEEELLILEEWPYHQTDSD